MQDEVDLLNVNQIVSISVNQNRLKEVFLMMMTKMNHYAARIFKLQTNHKQLQQTTERSIYSVQQRIQFNEKEVDNNISKIYMNITENRSDQEEINGKIEKMIHSKDREMRVVKERIEEVGEELENRICESSKEFGFLSENVEEMKGWKETFSVDVKEKVEQLRESIISVEARMGYNFKPRHSEQHGMDLVNHVHKGRQRNSEFVMRKSYMPKGGRFNNFHLNDQVSASNQTLNGSESEKKLNFHGDPDQKRNQNNQFVKEKLTCIEQQLERQRRIVDRKLINTLDERVCTDSSRDNTNKPSQSDNNFRGKKGENVQELRKEVLKAVKEMEGKMNECKVPQEEFDKVIKGINDKIHLLEMLVVNKCDKTQVKNAFSFLQKKLKELILVVTNNETEEKEGMLTQQQAIKCLSCKSFVEKQTNKVDYSYWKIVKGTEFNSLLEMKNDMRNFKGKDTKKRLERRTQVSSFYDKGNRRESKSMVYSNTVIDEKENRS